MIPIGIDLGTTYCAVATLGANGKPYILKNAEGSETTPSVIYFPDSGDPKVGAEAKERQKAGENAVASFFKREMGNPNFRLDFHGKSYNAEDLQSILLRKLKDDASTALGQPVEAAVITVPAYFNNDRREKTKEAAEKAGLRVLRIINEPTAAAFAYGVATVSPGEVKTYMVYDLGGGTFDVTVVRVYGNEKIEVLGTDGNHKLGGKDWDDRIARFLAKKFSEQFGDDPLADVVSFNELLVACEYGKKILSSRATTSVSITHGGNRGTYELSRETFVGETRDLMMRTERLCENVLEEIRKGLGDDSFDWDKLDGVLLVGGSTRMTMVGEYVERMSRKPVLRGVHPITEDNAVAFGAALQAAADIADEGEKNPRFSLEVKDGIQTRRLSMVAVPVVTDVIAHSLGVVGLPDDGSRSHYVNATIVRKNSQIPASGRQKMELPLPKKGEAEHEVLVTQGESDDPLECSIASKYVFTGFSQTKSGKAVIEVSYAYNRNGIIEVSAVQLDTGRELTKRQEPVPTDIMAWLARRPDENDPPLPSIPEVAVIIAVDTSGSMCNGPLDKAMSAAELFVNKMDLSHYSVGIISYAERKEWMCVPTKQNAKIMAAIRGLGSSEVGAGTSYNPFIDIASEFSKREYEDQAKFAIVLTDGQWGDQSGAIGYAKQCHHDGIQVCAIGFGDADHKFLKDISSIDEGAIFTASAGGLAEAFSKIATVISDRASVGIQRR